jgi:hypothetical protein
MNEPTTEMFSDELVEAMENLHQYPRLIAERAAREAVAAERARIREEMEGLPGYQFAMHHLREAVERAAVLTIVNPEAEG